MAFSGVRTQETFDFSFLLCRKQRMVDYTRRILVIADDPHLTRRSLPKKISRI